MRMIDVRCRLCGAVKETLQRNTGFIDRCICGGERKRIYATSPVTPSAVQGDDIPGGKWFKHGICNEDGTPKRYDTKHDITAALDKAGLMPLEHEIPVTSDEIERNLARPGYENTKRPLACASTLNVEDEAARKRAWHLHETQLQLEIKKKEILSWAEKEILKELES